MRAQLTSLEKLLIAAYVFQPLFLAWEIASGGTHIDSGAQTVITMIILAILLVAAFWLTLWREALGSLCGVLFHLAQVLVITTADGRVWKLALTPIIAFQIGDEALPNFHINLVACCLSILCVAAFRRRRAYDFVPKNLMKPEELLKRR